MRRIRIGGVLWGLMIAAGIICLVVSVIHAAQLLGHSRGTGVVHYYDTLERGQEVRRPRIDFTLSDGTRRSHTPQPGDTLPKLSEGQTVTILHTGKTALVDSPRLWFIPSIGLVLGALLLFAAFRVFSCAPTQNNSQAEVTSKLPSQA